MGIYVPPGTFDDLFGGGGSSPTPAVTRNAAPRTARAQAGSRQPFTKPDGMGLYDPFGDLYGLGMSYLNGGADSAGGGGGGGMMVSQAALRAALQNAYNQSESDRANVYGQIDTEIEGRAPGISQGYDSASNTLQQNALQRALAQRQGSQQRGQDDLQAAQLFGFEGIAPTANAGANAVMEENLGAQQGIADAWTGFYGAGEQTALERNQATGDAFEHMGVQQQLALQQMLQSSLLGAGDYFVGGGGGGGGGSALSANQKANLLVDLLGAYNSDTRNDIATTKLRPRTTQKVDSSGKGSTSTSYYN